MKKGKNCTYENKITNSSIFTTMVCERAGGVCGGNYSRNRQIMNANSFGFVTFNCMQSQIFENLI